MNKYETIFVISPEADEETIQSLIQRTKDIIEENGSIENVEEWGSRKLAYEVKGFREGYYVLMNFTAEKCSRRIRSCFQDNREYYSSYYC